MISITPCNYSSSYKQQKIRETIESFATERGGILFINCFYVITRKHTGAILAEKHVLLLT